MIQMVGPGGRDGCSKMNCLKPSIKTYVYTVAHPAQKVYDVQYKWCKTHDHVFSKQHYPNFYIKD